MKTLHKAALALAAGSVLAVSGAALADEKQGERHARGERHGQHERHAMREGRHEGHGNRERMREHAGRGDCAGEHREHRGEHQGAPRS